MQTGQLWDIFCTVIDNHGDLGVSWRLARQLRDAGQRVRLWVDDASALSWMAPDATSGAEPGITVLPWADAVQAAVLGALTPANVWIEAFGCTLPDAFVAQAVASRVRQPAWINLEYLSAETWVPGLHGLPSPVMSGPGKGWLKRFFYPGFTSDTGGLLREAHLLVRQHSFDRADWRQRHAPHLAADGQLISLFCYEPVALPQLLAQLSDKTHHLLVTPGQPLAAVQTALAERSGMATQPNWSTLPYTTQDGFDEMLWACDLNFVRGEDSLVRALWAGRPFVWHIYPQDDKAHHAKLEAFLDWLQAPSSLRRFHGVWNGVETGGLPRIDSALLNDWAACVQAARQRLLGQNDLVKQLLSHTANTNPAL